MCECVGKQLDNLSVIVLWNDTKYNGSRLGQSSLVGFIKINKSADSLQGRASVASKCVCLRVFKPVCPLNTQFLLFFLWGTAALQSLWSLDQRSSMGGDTKKGHYLFAVDTLFISSARGSQWAAYYLAQCYFFISFYCSFSSPVDAGCTVSGIWA